MAKLVRFQRLEFPKKHLSALQGQLVQVISQSEHQSVERENFLLRTEPIIDDRLRTCLNHEKGLNYPRLAPYNKKDEVWDSHTVRNPIGCREIHGFAAIETYCRVCGLNNAAD